MKKRLIINLFALGAILVLIAALYQSYTHLNRWNHSQRASGPSLTETTEKVQQALAEWEQVQQVFTDRHPLQAARQYRTRVLPLLEEAASAHPNGALPDGTAFTDLLDRTDRAYRETCTRAYTLLMDQLEQGRVSPDRVKTFHEEHPYPELDRIAQQREAAVLENRIRAAENWFRLFIELDSPLPGLEERIEEAYRQNWPETNALSLVVGPALTPEEQQLTWRTLHVKATLGYASYKKEQYSSFSHIPWEPPDIPILVEISNRVVRGQADVTTSWDSLSPVHHYLHPPKLVDETHADAIVENYRNLLVEGIGKELEAIPPFSYSPVAPTEAVTP